MTLANEVAAFDPDAFPVSLGPQTPPSDLTAPAAPDVLPSSPPEALPCLLDVVDAALGDRDDEQARGVRRWTRSLRRSMRKGEYRCSCCAHEPADTSCAHRHHQALVDQARAMARRRDRADISEVAA